MTADVIVIGGGPSGLMAAGTAKKEGKKVVLIEKNNNLGRKLLITGKGRCNVTTDVDAEDFFDNIVNNPRFLYSSFYSFTNKDVMEFFENLHVKLKVERGKRVFPVSDRASDILGALKQYIKDVKVIYEKAEKIIVEDNKVKGVLLSSKEVVEAEKVILATGGLSYPKTGSTGDGYKMAKDLGHSITKLTPALCPLILKGNYPEMLEGLSLKNVKVSLYDDKKLCYEDFGEMLFTKNGVSGPVILSMSSFVSDNKNYRLKIDLKPALSEEKLERRILSDFSLFNNKDFINSLHNLLPSKMIPVIVKMSKIPSDKKVNQITKEERKTLISLLKHMEFEIAGKASIDEAIVTAGGINVKEINPKTMESKIVKGLFFAGEIIDVHGYTGGFNLQIAFSTGHSAGTDI